MREEIYDNVRNNSSFMQINLDDMIAKLGEGDTKDILSNFSCPLNKEVEEFLRIKAIEFSKQGYSKTHLVYWDYKEYRELVGYYALANKTITVKRDNMSKTQFKKISRHGTLNKDNNSVEISAPLIGQIGKNFANGNDTHIYGWELLEMAIERISRIQSQIGGRIVYLECEDKQPLLDFYKENGFRYFNKRLQGRDETNLYGEYLIQLLRYL
jgi:hypothetical protein